MLDASRSNGRNTPRGVGKTILFRLFYFLAEKHPHGRGEDCWGQLPMWPSLETPPTGVGKTRVSRREHSKARKHPHGRGEDQLTFVRAEQEKETPPRAWGRLGPHTAEVLQVRNTPTGVGKTFRVGQHHPVARKHPHGRGEDGFRPHDPSSAHETPPRAWGRQDDLIGPSPTPTGVGKTLPAAAGHEKSEKHPHGRGEDNVPAGKLAAKLETPPRAWGRLGSFDKLLNKMGNTPTGVGKTGEGREGEEEEWKHPHGRGEDRTQDARLQQPEETPPRAWGRHREMTFYQNDRRNTPTGVGKTELTTTYSLQIRKHPHGRGEDLSHAASVCHVVETPPRAWGRHPEFEHIGQQEGNTPTGVGKTVESHI